MVEPNRVPRGVTGGGRFAPGSLRRAPVALDGDPSANELPSPEEVLTAEGDRLWQLVRHPDPLVRAECAANPYLTEEHRIALADPTVQPPEVRSAVARLPNPGVASRACLDPDPVVRWLAQVNGWDLTPAEREHLSSDTEVARVSSVMADQLAPSF